MINRIMYFSIHNKLIISVLVAGLVGLGIYSLTHLPLDAVPDITDNQVQIITAAPDLSAQEVERLITYPLELEMGNIPSVDEIRSISRFGLSVITIVFEEHIDIYWAREQINQKIQKAETEIPTDLGVPEMGPISTGLGEIYQYVIYPDDGYEDQIDATELRTIQDWIIRRQLIGLPGVVEVNSSGGYLKQFEISINQPKLKAFGITLNDVFKAVEDNNANAGGSYIEKENQTFFIRGEGMVRSIRDMENIVVKASDGAPVLLRSVAAVTIGHAPRFGAVTLGGKGEVVAGQVMMLKGENSMEVTRAVKARIEEIKQTLPEGVVLEPYLDRSKLVNRTTHTIAKNLIEGALIVIFILVLLLGNFRAGLIVASVIPISMLFAVSCMRYFGVSANLMSLGAIDFGLIVDGAVIIVEAILSHLRSKSSKGTLSSSDRDAEVFVAASEIRTSAAFGEIIILVVYLPIFFLQGVEGKMFIPMAQTVSFAILGALILSLTYVPMMSALFLKDTASKEGNISDRIVRFLYRLYAPIRDICLRFKYVFLLVTLFVFIGSVWLFSRMGSEFIPTLEEGDFALHQILPPGSSLRKGVDVSFELQEILKTKFPEVEKVVTKIGTAEIPTDIMPLEAGDIFVIMKPKDEWVSASSREEMFMKMEEELNKYPGVVYEFTQPIQMRFNELMTGIRQDIAIKIYGEDLGHLIELAHDAEDILEGIEGVGDIQVEPTAGLQQMVVNYDRIKMATYGVSIADINTIIKTSFAGKTAGKYYEGERQFDIVVRLRNDERTGIESLQNLNIDLPGGGYVPLRELAKISFEEGPTQISRDDTRRRITIGVNARNRDIASLIAEIKSSFDAQLGMPSGYFVRFGGQFENLERAQSRLALVVPIALALIFFLLYITFNSVKYALLIFTTIPLSAMGGIWALYIRGMPFSISAGVGFIALFGVAVLNGIVLIAYFNRLRQHGGLSLTEVIENGTKNRMRPVIMTAAVASLGFLPMALSTSAGAEVQQPLATVVIGGLITATFLTLIILPIIYLLIETHAMKKISAFATIFLALGFGSLTGQNELSLEEALEMFAENEQHFTSAAQWQLQSLDAKSEQPVAPGQWSLSLSGEEFNFDGISGVQSLIIQKNFVPGKLKKSYESLYGVQKGAVQNNLDLSILQLKKQLAIIYIEASYLRSLHDIEDERRNSYLEFVQIAEAKADLGETSRIPFRQSQLEIEDIEIRLEQVDARRQVQIEQLHTWLEDSSLSVPPLDQVTFSNDGLDVESHPILKSLQFQQEMLEAGILINDAQSMARPFVAARLQSVNGDFLYYGYQIGLNLRLNGAYREKQAEALKAQSMAHAEQWLWEKEQIDLKSRVLLEERAILQSRIDKINIHLIEHEALTSDIKIAYQMGEMNYTEMVVSYQSYYDLQKEQLDLLKESFLNLNQFIHYSN